MENDERAGYPSVAERRAHGRAARVEAPRGAHAHLELCADRNAIGRLEAEAATRVAELVPIRYGRMLASPLAYFRGAAGVMAHDLATAPRTGLDVQLCGDAHLLNFGGFASPERELVFDLNDFDETFRGPFEWDVKRLAASIEVASRERGLTDKQRGTAVMAAARSYRFAMRELARMGELASTYSHADAASLLTKLRSQHDAADARRMERVTARARAHDSMHALAKLTRMVDGEPRFVSKPPLLEPIADLEGDGRLEARVLAIFRSYRRSLPPDRSRLLSRFRYGDLARKVVGIGSVGTRCWVLLLIGRDARDPLFLQVKEAQASVLEPWLGESTFANDGRRVVEGQRLAQAVGDIFLGWTRGEDIDGTERDFYVRHLWDWKVSLELDRVRPRGLAQYAGWCGEALARAHARSGDRIAIAAYLGKGEAFDRAVALFARAYGDLNERDHAELRRAVEEGRLGATEGV